MSEDYLARKLPTAIWNTARGVWEKPGMENLFCAHSELYSETWPTEGTMRNGQVYELPTPTHPTTVSESSLLRSSTASQGEGGALGEDVARERGNTVGIRDQAMDLAKLNLLPTTRAQHGENRNNKIWARDLSKPQNLENALAMLPTPVVADAYTGDLKSKQQIEDQVHLDWGRFEAAVRRWEITLGREAPPPTKPDGKEGAHRLSSSFTEWMMGVPEGWITDCGLTRNEELKACGNGVVPQQAEMALRHLLKDVF